MGKRLLGVLLAVAMVVGLAGPVAAEVVISNELEWELEVTGGPPNEVVVRDGADGSNNEFGTIEDGLNNVAPGGTVLVKDGIYGIGGGVINVGKPVRLKADGEVTIGKSLLVESGGVEIDGFTITPGNDPTNAILVETAGRVEIRNNIINAQYNGIIVRNVGEVVIENNVVNGRTNELRYYGIVIGHPTEPAGALDAHLTGNMVSGFFSSRFDRQSYGIFLRTTGEVTVGDFSAIPSQANVAQLGQRLLGQATNNQVPVEIRDPDNSSTIWYPLPLKLSWVATPVSATSANEAVELKVEVEPTSTLEEGFSLVMEWMNGDIPVDNQIMTVSNFTYQDDGKWGSGHYSAEPVEITTTVTFNNPGTYRLRLYAIKLPER